MELIVNNLLESGAFKMFLIMLSLLISLVIVIFSVQNSIVVPIIFFNWSSEVPLVIVIFASVFAGATIIFCLALWKEFKRKFGTVSSKASIYKGKLESKKDSLTTKKNSFNAMIGDRLGKKDQIKSQPDNKDIIVIDASAEPTSDSQDKITVDEVITGTADLPESVENTSSTREEGPIPIEEL